MPRTSTRMVLSTKGTPSALAMLNTGITGSTSNLSHDQMSDGRNMMGRSLPLPMSLASTARLAAR